MKKSFISTLSRIPLLTRIIIAIICGLLLGQVLTLGWVRVFATFNGVFSQLLAFLIPLIIVGLVAPSIADVGHRAGPLLLYTVGLAYGDTILAGMLAYGVGCLLFPDMVAAVQSHVAVEQATAVEPYFIVSIPPPIDVMAALVLSFVLGLGIAYKKRAEQGDEPLLASVLHDFKSIIERTIGAVVIPLLPIYIFGIFLMMAHTGEAYRILLVFAQIIGVIFLLHLAVLMYEFCIAGAVTRRNPLRLLWTMLPAYMTALGTASSAATIPVTLRQTLRNGVAEDIAGFTVPLCATIHMSGSAMKIVSCALTICLLEGLPFDLPTFLHFTLMLGVVMVAAPGVPGGAIMAALAPLSLILGFGPDQQALMIALYIAMDSFGTACNVTGDGAIALIVNRITKDVPN